MPFSLSYQTLFEVRLLHHYFLDDGATLFDNLPENRKQDILLTYNAADVFEIIPTSGCSSLLRGLRCVVKLSGDKLICGIRMAEPVTETDPVPLLLPDQSLRFTFYVYLKNSEFANITTLPIDAGETADKIFFGANYTLSGTEKRYPYLTSTPPVFNGARKNPGDMVSNSVSNPTKLFIAITGTTQAPPNAGWVEDDLVSGDPLCYVHAGDLVHAVKNIFRQLVDVPAGFPAVSVTNSSDEQLPMMLDENYFFIPVSDHKFRLEVNLQLADAGWYTLQCAAVNGGNAFLFYVLDPVMPRPFAIIDVATESDLPDYNLMENDELRSPSFELRWKNRSTIWRYMDRNTDEFHRTAQPLPLTHHGHIADDIIDPDDDVIEELPNPSRGMISFKYDSNKNLEFICSDIIINS